MNIYKSKIIRKRVYIKKKKKQYVYVYMMILYNIYFFYFYAYAVHGNPGSAAFSFTQQLSHDPCFCGSHQKLPA